MSIAGRDNSLVSNDFGNQIPIVKRLKTRRKSALFLSIEMICIMIVIAIIIVAVAASTKYLYELYEIQTISKEFTMYREAFKKFKASYGYEAGMVPDAYLVGDINILSISDATTRANGMESFRQLAMAGLIPKNLVNFMQNSSTALNGLTTANYNTLYDSNVFGVILPKASWNSDFHFNAGVNCSLWKYFRSDVCNNATSFFLPSHGVNFGFQYISRLMAMLHHNAYLNGNEYNVWVNSPRKPLVAVESDAGTISGVLANKIDSKIDDGHPGLGWIMANDVRQTTDVNDSGCTYISSGWYGGVQCKTTPDGISFCYGNDGPGRGYTFTDASVFRNNVKYQNNTKASPKTGCIMFVDISTS